MKNAKEKVVIYVKGYCPFCKKAKALLDEKGVKYEEIDVTDNPNFLRQGMLEYGIKVGPHDKITVPQIFITDKDGKQIHIKGNDELQRLNKEGKLDDMLNHNDGQVDVMIHTDNNIEHEECTTHNDDLI
ncbi:MAG: Glutaredoxin 3 [Wolbachia endosymbiont of Ctenocephalides orientis wCori]|nr:MAG: Glutaredoxin 3 [Wolbachia endosymbiont of Ctenocephalides orientis wCori]